MDLDPGLSAILNGANASFLENLYQRYERDPNAVEPEWRAVERMATELFPHKAPEFCRVRRLGTGPALQEKCLCAVIVQRFHGNAVAQHTVQRHPGRGQ